MNNFQKYLEESLVAEIKSEPKTASSKEAKRLGLTYMGFGRYADKKGNLAYIVDNDRLVPYKGRQEVQNMQSKSMSVVPSAKKSLSVSNNKQQEASFYNDVLNRREKQDSAIIKQKNKEAQALSDALYKFYSPNMFSAEELDAISNYTSEGYGEINRYLYKGHDQGATADMDEYLNNTIDALDSAFEETQAPFSYTVYSGLSSRYSPEKLKAGGEYIFRGYVSSSVSFGVAIDGFAETEISDSPVVLQIEVKKGQKSIYVDPISDHQGEGETLLPRGSKIKIISGPHIIDDAIVSESPWGTKIHLFHCQIVEDL